MDDNLFVDYHRFRQGEKLDKQQRERIRALLHYFKGDCVSNIAQYERTGLPLDVSLKKQLAQSGLKKQTLEELAQAHTLYRIVLCCDRSDFPYVNVMSTDEKIESTIAAFYDYAERRDKCIKHLKALCAGAREITIYDKYLCQKEQRNLNLLKQILPNKRLIISFYELSDRGLIDLKSHNNLWKPEVGNHLKRVNRHDRYIVVDNQIEIILSSGLDHLSDDSSDFMYAVRVIDESRFQQQN
ncbi:MAG: hypothetical protein IJ160_12895 [Muribaculaceae bacterium]|nr:hypothetical protein [Muribaculaceae bacterium]